MSAFASDGVYYKSVIGSSLADRSAFDGSVPYCVSCSGYFGAGSTISVAKTFFSVVGQANVDGVRASAARDGLVKQCRIDLTDIKFLVSGSGKTVVRITVCEPTAFPTSADHVYLYERVLVTSDTNGYAEFDIPDITGIIVNGTSAQPLNVCVYVESTSGYGRDISFHCVASIDD